MAKRIVRSPRYSGALFLDVVWVEDKGWAKAFGYPHGGYYEVRLAGRVRGSARAANQYIHETVPAPTDAAWPRPPQPTLASLRSPEAYDAAVLQALVEIKKRGASLEGAERTKDGIFVVSRAPSCVEHADCRAHPELGRACLASRTGRPAGRSAGRSSGRKLSPGRSPTVWVLLAAGQMWRVRTSSARDAIERVQVQTRGAPVKIVGIVSEPLPPLEKRLPAEVDRRRKAFFDKAIKMWESGRYSLAEIGRELKIPRETVRDWVRQATAAVDERVPQVMAS